MNSFTGAQLEIIADVISIGFFVITVLLLIGMTIKYNRIFPGQASAENAAGFNEELVQRVNYTEQENVCVFDEHCTDRYKDAERLADLGMSPGEISEKIGIPKNEIELIVRLKKFGLTSRLEDAGSKSNSPVQLPAKAEPVKQKSIPSEITGLQSSC